MKLAALIAAAAAVAVTLAAAPVDLPDPAAGLSSASSSLGEWAYLAVPGLAFLETAAFVGLLVPGETAVVVGGVVAERGDVALAAMIALVWMGAVTGDLVSFALGRRLGRPFLDSHGARLRIRPEHVERVERFFARYGGRAVLLGRFVGILRALTPFVAGASRLPLQRFLPYSLLGALAWAAAFTVVGYAFASSFESAGETAARLALAGAVVVAAVLLLAARLHRNLTQRRATASPRMNDTLLYTRVDSRIGDLLLVGDGRMLRGLYIQEGRTAATVAPEWHRADEPFAAVAAQLSEYFDGERRDFDVPLAMSGTPFQRRVWDSLREIPYGETITYGELGRRVGRPSASRAVGLANGRNPISVIVPCHRVIGSDGTLTGYGGGLERKRLLLELEAGSAASAGGLLRRSPATAARAPGS